MRRLLTFLFVGVFVFTLVGCSGGNAGSGGKGADSGNGQKDTASADNGKKEAPPAKDSKVEKNKDGAVLIKFPSYKTGNNVGAKFFLPQLDRFNEKYKGKYFIEVETIVQDEYPNKLKLLYQQGKMPPLVEVSGDKEFMQIVLDNGDLLDLKPYIDNAPEIKNVLIDDSVAFNTDKDGKILSLPLAFQRPIGLYYNKEIFANAGLNGFPKTWDEFFSALDKLKATGKVPLSLMTGENAWTTMLFATAMMASDPEGYKILNSKEIVKDFNSKIWIDTFAKVQQMLQKYSSETALGAPYAVAANEFLSENAAIIANGPWMVSDFSDTDKTSEGFNKKVGSAIYPGGIALGSTDGYWYSIPKNTPQEIVDGLIEYFKFIYSPDELNAFLVAEGGFAPKVPMPDEYKQQLDPILAELNGALESDMKQLSRLIYDIVPQSVSDLFAKNLPLLVTNDMTPEQFCQAMTEAAQKFQ
ncbi:ABC transporter substrate-binding protein [Paenibacillus thermotolerans]|uniref:ABC transporter substrate-binding protein n=1 Tax=Paenibacillus thermotolerans TaxID=3027807 RepID=UPI0023675172|nr:MULTISPECIES: extracellular solute-binding protein [unclassified Paenibacillus]